MGNAREDAIKDRYKSSKPSKKYTSSNIAGGVVSQTQAGIDKVKKELGITEIKHGPMDYLQVPSGTKDVHAFNLADTKGGTSKFGSEASQATNEYLVSIGEAKQGNPYYDHKGNITGYSYMLTSKGKEMKYGKSGGAMGSGDPTGIMSSIPISKKMHDTQKTIQGIALAAMSLAFPQTGVGSVGGFIARSASADAFKNKSPEGYTNMITKFHKKQGTVISGGKAKLSKTIMTDDEMK